MNTNSEKELTPPELKSSIQEKYGAVARGVADGDSCCNSTLSCSDPITKNLYKDSELAYVPAEAAAASLGCGNPTVLAQFAPGETVLDLGAGGGIDVLLSAKRVGPSGFVYGLDMTDEMLALARENQRKAGAANVEFLKGEIENIPLPNNSVDVVISNCVINLSLDKDKVFREIFRVLKPGGRVAVSDVVMRGEVPASLRKHVDLWIGCIAGALEENEYKQKLARVGFVDISAEPWRIYEVAEMRDALEKGGVDVHKNAIHLEGKFMSASIRARKPR